MAANKAALITGAAKRVGRAIAIELASSGYDVAVHYHASQTDAERTRDDIVAMGRRCALVQGDLADLKTPAAIVSKAVDALGRLDVLVNNAAVFGKMSLDGWNLADWNRELQINLTAPASLCHHAAPHLAATGAGCIVNLCDISAARPWPGHLAYCVSKAGLVALTKALARELAPHVRVNAVSPGIAVFPADYDQPTRDKLTARVPLARPGTPEDIARTVRFLIDDADYMTGQVLHVDGGRSIA